MTALPIEPRPTQAAELMETPYREGAIGIWVGSAMLAGLLAAGALVPGSVAIRQTSWLPARSRRRPWNTISAPTSLVETCSLGCSQRFTGTSVLPSQAWHCHFLSVLWWEFCSRTFAMHFLHS